MRDEQIPGYFQDKKPKRVGTADPVGTGTVVDGEIPWTQDRLALVLGHDGAAADGQVDQEVILGGPADHFRRPEHRMGLGDYWRDPQGAEALSRDLSTKADGRPLQPLDAELHEGGTDDLTPVAQLRPLVDGGGREGECHGGCLAG